MYDKSFRLLFMLVCSNCSRCLCCEFTNCRKISCYWENRNYTS